MGKILTILLFLTAICSCVYRKVEKPVTQMDCRTLIPDTASFNKDVLPILVTNCANPGCHSGANPQGNLKLNPANAYNEITSSSKGYIDTLEPVNSVLYNTLTSPANLMPPSGKLPDCQIEIIMKWMAQNARNN